jgi:thymidylate synthase
MNSLDKQYQALLQDILDNGVEKKDRTGTGTISVFGRSIRYKFKDGKFPLLTTKKMAFKTMVTELLWFLRGDTNIKYLVDNNCHIWDGDAYKNYKTKIENYSNSLNLPDGISEFQGAMDIVSNQIKSHILTQEEFINKIKTDDEFAKKWGDLGPVYGKQWRRWEINEPKNIVKTENVTWPYEPNPHTYQQRVGSFKITQIDQIANLINGLKTNPDSRRLMVNAWNVGEIDQMVLPPCHYGFQVYTRELSLEERKVIAKKVLPILNTFLGNQSEEGWIEQCEKLNVPTRAISLMWNQRSCDIFLGIPFNIASYGLLLEIIAKEVNMIPDELIGNLGDVHLYSNHIEQAKEQINREPFQLPELTLEHSSLGPAELVYKLEDYQSHPTIKAPLSN